MSSGQAPAADQHEVWIVHAHQRAWHKADLAASPGVAVAASRQVISHQNAGAFGGWSIRESTGAAGASFRLHDGSDANGEIIANCDLVANESVRDWFGEHGIRVDTGRIWLEVISGSVEGVIYWR